MERDSVHGTYQPPSLYKSHIRNMEPFLSTPNSYSFSPSKGLLKAPPLSLFHSTPFSLQPPPQPPLLPLPRRPSSCPAPAVKSGTRKPRDQKKSTKSSSTSKNNRTIAKKDEKKTTPERSSVTVASTSKFRPDQTAALPKNIASVARFDDSVKDYVIRDRVDMFLGSVVLAIASPPPNSLPLPTFSLRPKLSCNGGGCQERRRSH